MKKLSLVFAAVLLAGTCAIAQTQIPEFKNTPMILKKDGSLEKLEKQNATLKNKGGNRGGWGYTPSGDMEYITIEGGASPVRCSLNPVFIVKLTDTETDPESVFYLTEVVVNRGKAREIYVKKDFGRSVKEKYVDLKYEKVEPGVYKIIPATLKPGVEYSFVSVTQGSTGQSIVYLFGTEGTAK